MSSTRGNAYELPNEQVEMASDGAEVVCPKCFQAMLPTNAYERELLRALLLRTLKIVSLAQVVTRSIKAIVTELLPTLDEAQLSPAMARWLASASDIEETIQLLPPVLHEAMKDM